MLKKLFCMACVVLLAFGAPVSAFADNTSRREIGEAQYPATAIIDTALRLQVEKKYPDIEKNPAYVTCTLVGYSLEDWDATFESLENAVNVPANAIMAASYRLDQFDGDSPVSDGAIVLEGYDFAKYFDAGGLNIDDLEMTITYQGDSTGELIASTFTVGDEALDPWYVHTFRRVPTTTSTTITVSFSLLDEKQGVSSSNNAQSLSSDTDSSSDEVSSVTPQRDGRPALNVEGTSGVRAWGNLKGSNIPNGANITLAAKRIVDGAIFDELLNAIGQADLLDVFEVDLSVNDTPIHDEFGNLILSFPVSGLSDKNLVTVWHRHDDGSITHQTVEVDAGEAAITVTDLSTFAIGKADAGVDVAMHSPKTGQSVTSFDIFSPISVVAAGLVAIFAAFIHHSRMEDER